MPFCFFLDVATELGQRRVAVDLRGFDRRLILLIDLSNPCHAADRIEAEIDELSIVVDVALSHLELVRQERFQARGDGAQHIAVKGSVRRSGLHLAVHRWGHDGRVGPALSPLERELAEERLVQGHA